MNIGVACWPTYGGSGVVATAIAEEMGRRGHHIHLVSAERPRRLAPDAPNVSFHEVRARDYPVFADVPYALALASALVTLTERHGLHVLHAHYAVPHATSAWMAREVLGGRVRVVTTLHGTDVALGADDSYRPITRHSLLTSDAITAPSAFLRDEARARLDLDVPIEVVPNFVDPDAWRPLDGPAEAVLVHVSNFRPVKRVDRVVEVFDRVVRARPARLLLVGDGPERGAIEADVRRRGLADRVAFLDEQDGIAGLLRGCAALLLPSDSESFGLVALEALASGVPVVGSAVGGLPEVVRDGVTGFLLAPDDVAGMAARVVELLDPDRRAPMARAARADAVARFSPGPAVDRYEAIYRRVVGR